MLYTDRPLQLYHDRWTLERNLLLLRVLPKFLRSRGTRERLLICFAGARKREFLDCKLAAPVRFFRGFEPRFRVHLLRHACSFFCGFFRSFQRFEVFFEQVFHSDCIRQKRECSPNADGVRFFGRAKTNYIIAKHVYTRRFVRDRSFLDVFWREDSGPCEACLVSMRDNVLLLHSWDERLYFILFTRKSKPQNIVDFVSMLHVCKTSAV